MKETLEEKYKQYSIFWDAYYNDVYAYCFKKLGDNPEDVEDIVQEVFAVLWLNMLKETKISKVKPWLVATAKNKIYKKYVENAKKRKRETALDDVNSAFLLKKAFDIDEERMQDYVIEDIYEKANSLLKEDEQELLEMLYDKRMSHEEIAGLFGTTANAVKQRAYRSNVKMKLYVTKRLKEMGLKN